MNRKRKTRRQKRLTTIMWIEGIIAVLAVLAAMYYWYITKDIILPANAGQEAVISSEAPVPASSSETPAASETSEALSQETETESETPFTSEEETPEITDAETSSETEPAPETSSEAESAPESASPEETETLPGPRIADYSRVVFIGDSRTLCLSSGGELEYRLVPESSVCATWGGQLVDATAFGNAGAAGSLGREKGVFWYGINDVQLNPDRDHEEVFVMNYDRIINAYTSVNPGSEIYVLSILNTTPEEKDHYPAQEENVEKYNRAMQAYCEEHGYHFIDISFLEIEGRFAEGDNIHFSQQWYTDHFVPYVTEVIGILTEQ